MKSTAGKVIVTLCVLGALGAFLIIYSLLSPPGAGGQVAAQLQDTGNFRVGSVLGQDYTWFSGQAMVKPSTRLGVPASLTISGTPNGILRKGVFSIRRTDLIRQ